MKPNRSNIKSVGFEMQIVTKHKLYAKVTEQQKEQQKEDLKKELPEDEGIDVDIEKRGLVIRMGEILFDFDSFNLRNGTYATLDKIIDVLKRKYRNREIIVEGHTDNIGTKEYNNKLSLKRAQKVAEYLKKQLKHDKLSFRGLGSSKPMADNNKKIGRQKNRRVEIIIKLN
jgi:outer membrane protein OmpA-like peptidoglycan-associated protein